MSDLIARYVDGILDLKVALQGIRLAPDARFDYLGEAGQATTESPAFALPIDSIDDGVFGFFRVADRSLLAPIGFSYKGGFVHKQHYDISVNGRIKGTPHVDGVLYLPLEETALRTKAHLDEEPAAGTTLSVLGIQGLDPLHPLILITITGHGVMARGIGLREDEVVLYPIELGRQQARVSQIYREATDGIARSLPVSGTVSESKTLFPGQKEGEVKADPASEGPINWREPKSIQAYLDRFVIGQSQAKISIATAFSIYMHKVLLGDEGELPKENMLIVGPSGVGKTLSLKVLSEQAGIPFVETSATGKSSTGYVGENFETVLQNLRREVQGEAPYAVVFIDEIDKISALHSGGGDGFKSSLQDELVGWLEDGTVTFRSAPGQDVVPPLSTRNILWITAGAFQGLGPGTSLTALIEKRLGRDDKEIGFAAEKRKEETDRYPLLDVTPEDIIAYGLKPELVGRLASLAIFQPLSVEEKVRILTEAERSPLKKYKLVLELDGYKVDVDEDVHRLIAKSCPEETGARALTAICTDLFAEIIYEPDLYADAGRTIHITVPLAKQLINLYSLAPERV